MAFTSRSFRLFSPLFLGLLVVALILPQIAEAGAPSPKTLGASTNRIYDSLISLQFFLSLLSYILGTFFFITGFKQLRDHVNDPDRNPLKNAVLRLIGAAFFIFAPILANYLVRSLGGDGVGDTDLLTVRTSAFAPGGGGPGAGLEGALARFVTDFGGPFLDNLIPLFAYLAGVILMLVGLKRLALANGDGPQAPGGMGTIGTFLVAAGLMAFGYIMYTFQMSIFGASDLVANQAFNTATPSPLSVTASRTLWGVFIFLRIVGYISVLRGLFMLRAMAEGNGNVSLMSVGTHMIAGSLLANGGYFVNALQYTFLGTDVSRFVFAPI